MATKTKPKPKPAGRTRASVVSARLSTEERADLDAIMTRCEARAAEQGFVVEGFTDWLRSIINREKRALPQDAPAPKR